MFVQNLFLVLFAALIGGLAARMFKIPTLIGYILAGIIFSTIFPFKSDQIEGLAQLGIILLLFSIGTELSFKRLNKVGVVVIKMALIQILLVSLILWLIISIFGIKYPESLILAIGFSYSSTALIVKILEGRGELGSIQADLMIAWNLVQDLAVVPVIIILPALGSGSAWFGVSLKALALSVFIIILTFFLGKKGVPFLIHKIASFNSRELLFLTAISLALGMASLTAFFGISPSLGAFLAGLVISETQENHAIFSEIRPLRDIFVTLFFVTLGFMLTPGILIAHFGLIITLVLAILFVKFIVIYSLSLSFNIKGKTALYLSLGLNQVGEFSFILFMAARGLNLITNDLFSIGISSTLISLILSPFIIKGIVPVWRKIKNISESKIALRNLLLGRNSLVVENRTNFKNHIIICGFGRVGGWIGKAFDSAGITYLVIDYNQKVVMEVQKEGIPVIYGDPADAEVLEQAGVRDAKGIIIAVPDRTTQEEIISYVQTVNPEAKIISRAHLDEDWERLSTLKVSKVVQPEFEAALSILREVFNNMGKSSEEITARLKSIKFAHAIKK